MKKQTFLLTMLLLFAFTVFGQNCSTFYPLEKGTQFQITNYNKKGAVITTASHRVSTVKNSGGNTEATLTTEMKDEKGKVITEGEYTIQCNGKEVSLDVTSLLSPDLFQQFEGMETDIKGTNVVIPNPLTEGQSLPDASMEMKIDMGGIPMNMTVLMTDRKVLGMESVTTPAGTFDCYVIGYTSTVKMGMNRTGSAKQWLAKGVGLVKQEDYNKKGKLTGSAQLTEFSKS